VRCPCVLDEDFKGIAPGAAWDDVKLDVEHRKDFERTDAVTDDRWVRLAVQLGRPFFGGELRLFPVAGRAEAGAWIQEGRGGWPPAGERAPRQGERATIRNPPT